LPRPSALELVPTARQGRALIARKQLWRWAAGMRRPAADEVGLQRDDHFLCDTM
jgi:hypothetical protein